MAEEQGTLRSVNWNEVFSFSQIFRSFRLAVQPSKLALAAAAIVILFLSGWVLDRVWGVFGATTQPAAPALHATLPGSQFQSLQERWADRETRRRAGAQEMSQAQRQARDVSSYIGDLPDGPLRDAFRDEIRGQETDVPLKSIDQLLDENKKASGGWFVGKAEDYYDEEIDKIEAALPRARKRAEEVIGEEITDEAERADALDELSDDYAAARRELSARRLAQRQNLRALRGQGIGETFWNYEWRCLRAGLTSIWYGNFTGGLYRYQQIAEARGPQPIAATENFQPYGWTGWFGVGVPNVRAAADFDDTARVTAPIDRPVADPPGFLVSCLMACRGVVWMLSEHTIYAIVYLAVALCALAFFGGAIGRMAALQFARDEKISVMQAMRFACGKFLSFLTAPLIPLVLIVVLGLIVSALSLLFNIPFIGEILAGLGLPLLLVFGLGMAFLAIGLVAGGPLMFPTIAVEGSDAFDAISRSFSYVFSRPWRSILYGFLAVVYGGLTYMFVRLFGYLALKSTHTFMKLGTFVGGDRLAENADKVDVVWAEPTYASLWGPFNWDAMSGGEMIGAFLFGIWTFLVAAVVGGYLLSYFVSASTVIYCLLRRKVDATDLDDVYVEEEEEWPVPPAEGTESETSDQAESEESSESASPSEEAERPEPGTNESSSEEPDSGDEDEKPGQDG